MTLIVEDGTGLSTAESYISVADADTHHTNMGNADWTGTTTEKEQALRRATAFMEQRYRLNWKGTRLLRAQALSWPRYGAIVDSWPIESTLVPADVVKACADLALKALAGPLTEDQTRAVIREKVGPLETEYSPHSPQGTRYVSVCDALSPYMKGGAGMACVVRA